jgi:ABC-2 type transport system ATP-binding protein
VLTDVMFIHLGRVVLSCSMDQFESRYVEVSVRPEKVEAARVLKPVNERQALGRTVLLFDGIDRQKLGEFGDVRTPSIADVFVALLGDRPDQARGAAS